MHIPNEIHDMIISDLRPGDYSNYRLIGHSFAQAMIPHVFRTVRFSPKLPSLRNLARIADQEHINRHVQHLEWTSDQFATENKEAQLSFGDKEWEAVRDIMHRDRQEREGHADTGSRLLTLVLRQFPNLKTLRIGIHDNPGPTERRLDPSDPSSMIRGEYEMYTLLTAAHAAGCPITEFSLWSGNNMHPLFRTNIWLSLVPVCKDLTSLSLPVSFALGTEEKERWLRRREDEGLEESETIAEEFATVCSDHSTAAQIASFQAFLGTLTHLRTLKLNCRAEQWDEDWRKEMTVHKKLRSPLLEAILPTKPFQFLNQLQLDYPSTSTAYLKAFLTKHKETLEVFKLSSVKFAICGAEDEYERYPDEGCVPLKRFMEYELDLEEWELTCENCGCNLWECCRQVGGLCC
jgi:hypothetical protein